MPDLPPREATAHAPKRPSTGAQTEASPPRCRRRAPRSETWRDWAAHIGPPPPAGRLPPAGVRRPRPARRRSPSDARPAARRRRRRAAPSLRVGRSMGGGPPRPRVGPTARAETPPPVSAAVRRLDDGPQDAPRVHLPPVAGGPDRRRRRARPPMGSTPPSTVKARPPIIRSPPRLRHHEPVTPASAVPEADVVDHHPALHLKAPEERVRIGHPAEVDGREAPQPRLDPLQEPGAAVLEGLGAARSANPGSGMSMKLPEK